MSVISMKQLLEAGVHFGHQTRRWNPKMKKYIFVERNGIYIIDLQKTVKKLEEAYDFMRQVGQDGGKVLFVGTKKQAQEAIKDEAERSGNYYLRAPLTASKCVCSNNTICNYIIALNDSQQFSDGISVKARFLFYPFAVVSLFPLVIFPALLYKVSKV